ncbi:MAG: hypothetical protein HY909_27530 [Deltaproteobacteria bacterium]|nr:hypothetical protein [Deltaproteobacteria bacterium]
MNSLAMRGAWTFATILAWAPAPAIGQVTQCADPSQARGEFQRGQGALGGGRFAEARRAFEQAYHLCHQGEYLERLAVAEQALGLWVESNTHFTQAIEDTTMRQRRTELEGERARVRQHLARILLTGEGPTSRVTINEHQEGTWPMTTPVWVPAGSVVVVLRTEGYLDWRRELNLRGGELSQEPVVLVQRPQAVAPTPDIPSTAEPPPEPGTRIPANPAADASGVPRTTLPPQPPAMPPTSNRTLRLLGLTSAGLAVVSLGAGVVGALVLGSREADYFNNDSCRPHTAGLCDVLYNSYANSGMAELANIGFVASGAFGVAATVLLLASRGSVRSTTQVGLACGAGPGELGLACGGRF